MTAPDGYPVPRFSATEMQRRWDLVTELLAREDLDALLVTGSGRFQADIYWLTDWPGGREGYAVFPRGQPPALLVQFYNHLPTARRLCAFPDVRWAGPEDMATVADVLRERSLDRARVGVAGKLSFTDWTRLTRELPDLILRPVGPAYQGLRLVRSEEEIERFRTAARLTDEAMAALARELRPGLAEEAIAAILERPMLEAGGYAGIHYVATMPMDGPYLPVPAQYLSRRLLGPGDVVTTEVTGCYWGYQGQIHRTYSLGQMPSDPWRRLHDAAVETFTEILSVLRPGRTAEEAVAAADRAHAHGYLFFDDVVHGADQHPPVLRSHATAHQPYPRDFVFAAGMVVVVQPNPYDPATHMGLQFGETVVIRPEGPERLHTFPQEWTVVAL